MSEAPIPMSRRTSTQKMTVRRLPARPTSDRLRKFPATANVPKLPSWRMAKPNSIHMKPPAAFDARSVLGTDAGACSSEGSPSCSAPISNSESIGSEGFTWADGTGHLGPT